MTVTVEQFKTAKPQFADVPNETVQVYLDMAATMVDASWGNKMDPGQIAFACHLMTLDGLGTDPQSKAIASGAADFSSIRSGELTLTRFKQQASDGTDYSAWLNSTNCGRFFAFLLGFRRGPLGISISSGCGPSPYAKDWCGPNYGWPGVFG